MPESDDFLESNTVRLIGAGLGGDARLNPELRESMRRRLAGELNAKTADKSPFPEKALILLTALGLLAVLVILAQFSRMGAQTFNDGLWPVLALLLLLNIALTPVASIVIIAGRRSHGQAD